MKFFIDIQLSLNLKNTGLAIMNWNHIRTTVYFTEFRKKATMQVRNTTCLLSGILDKILCIIFFFIFLSAFKRHNYTYGIQFSEMKSMIIWQDHDSWNFQWNSQYILIENSPYVIARLYQVSFSIRKYWLFSWKIEKSVQTLKIPTLSKRFLPNINLWILILFTLINYDFFPSRFRINCETNNKAWKDWNCYKLV